jgi:mannose-6-phosphate isomerase-like protein (cupin superfamily)
VVDGGIINPGWNKPMLRLSRMIRLFCLTTTLVSAAPSLAQDATGAIKTWSPDTIEWQIDRPQGTKLTLLQGDWSIPGSVFTYAFKMPDGAWFPPHHHPALATITVLKGTLLLGTGEKMDKTTATALGVGQVAVVPAGVAHYEGARGETIIIGTATAPWGTVFHDAPKASNPGN